jgi:uncharacterized Tic20 family protein
MIDFSATYEPNSDEKTMATLAHVLQLVGWWIAPLIIYLIKRDSNFVAFHARQALLWQGFLVILWLGTMAVWFVIFFATVFLTREILPQIIRRRSDSSWALPGFGS